MKFLYPPHLKLTVRSYALILDGHHSLAAAIENGEDPIFTEYDSTEHDAICLLEFVDIEGFLQATHMGDDYYNVEPGKDIW